MFVCVFQLIVCFFIYLFVRCLQRKAYPNKRDHIILFLLYFNCFFYIQMQPEKYSTKGNAYETAE